MHKFFVCIGAISFSFRRKKWEATFEKKKVGIYVKQIGEGTENNFREQNLNN